ncbi:MAG: hypothetical protein L0Z70_07815 [Chloroflexi bacterium]|nr:hypothetical protein [Chloroflexota bacterium]
MIPDDLKPLNWTPRADIGYTVIRRPDGGMHFTFSDLSPATLSHWREFSLQHLLDSDRLTRNLYDLRQIKEFPEDAVQYAIEVNNDPSVRNIRLAVVAEQSVVIEGLQRIAALTTPGGVEMALFASIEEAEAWLNRPLTLVV